MKKLMIFLITPIFVCLGLKAQAVADNFAPGMAPPGPGFELPAPGFPADSQGETSCLGYPEISIDKIKPENVWAPAGKEVTVEVFGDISPAEGCEILSLEYSMDSDNGPVFGSIDIGTGGGSYHATFKVDLSKNGEFKEGRTYRGLISAVQNAEKHKSTRPFGVTVLHDRGK